MARACFAGACLTELGEEGDGGAIVRALDPPPRSDHRQRLMRWWERPIELKVDRFTVIAAIAMKGDGLVQAG
jgi:hypothetical protein